MASNHLLGAVALALTLLAAPAAAQDGSEASAARTPENAQRFLTVMADQYPLIMSTTPGWQHANLDYRVTKVVANGGCSTWFDGAIKLFRGTDANNNLIFVPGDGYADPAKNDELFRTRQDLVARNKLKPGPYAIDWSKVTFLGHPTINYGSSSITHKTGVQVSADELSLAFWAPSEELAGRMLLAMQTLKQACDKTEGLGF